MSSMTQYRASLVICAHNPRPDYFARVISGCLEQRGLSSETEIVIVDSASASPLVGWGEKSPNCRIIRSEEPGLARARVLGIRESKGGLVVFVDDDTVLTANYVAESMRILAERPYLAAIGGQLLPEFEGDLPLQEFYYRNYLAIREFSQIGWSNCWEDFATSPIGGGMVVRRNIAEAWADRAESSSWRIGLGRSGGNLSGGEDIDLLQMTCEKGYGKGIFPELKLTHLMPAQRLSPDFIVRIFEGNCRSGAYLSAMLNPAFMLPPSRLRYRLKVVAKSLMLNVLDRKLYLAGERGRWAGWRQAANDKG